MKKQLSLFFIILLTPFITLADNHSPQVISDTWEMVPKMGHEAKFEEAMKAHLAYRKANGDTRQWNTWRPVTGSNLNSYFVRSCCTTWAAQDENNKVAANLSAHFNENVNPHVKKYTHNFAVQDTENSHWPEDTKANFVGVTSYTFKPGMGGARSQSIKQMSTLAKEKGWPRAWSWGYSVGGPSSWMLVTPFENYADMAPMEESFYEFAIKHMESAEKVDEMFAKFTSTFTGSGYTIYRHDKALSTQQDKK